MIGLLVANMYNVASWLSDECVDKDVHALRRQVMDAKCGTFVAAQPAGTYGAETCDNLLRTWRGISHWWLSLIIWGRWELPIQSVLWAHTSFAHFRNWQLSDLYCTHWYGDCERYKDNPVWRLLGETVKRSLVTWHQLVSPSTLPSTALGTIKTASNYTAEVKWCYSTQDPLYVLHSMYSFIFFLL